MSGKYFQSEGAKREWSTVVDIFITITPPSFHLIWLFYHSANCKLSCRQYFQSLLKENGILVGSFENVLLKMNKTTTDEDVQEISVESNNETCTSLTEIEFPFPCENNSNTRRIVLQNLFSHGKVLKTRH